MTAALLAGAGVGFGVVLVLGALLPARPSLAAASARLHRASPAWERRSMPVGVPTGWARRLAHAIGLQHRFGPSVRSDLRLVGRSLDDHVAASVATALGGAALVPAIAALMWIGGVSVPFAVPAAASLLGGGGWSMRTDAVPAVHRR